MKITDSLTFQGMYVVSELDDQGRITWSRSYHNVITDEGLKRVMDILKGDETEDIELEKLELGTSDDDPTDRSKSALVTAIEDKIDFTSESRGTSFPFELVKTVTISSSDITRPVTVKEMGVFFGDDVMFSRVVLDPNITFASGVSNTISYGLYLT